MIAVLLVAAGARRAARRAGAAGAADASCRACARSRSARCVLALAATALAVTQVERPRRHAPSRRPRRRGSLGAEQPLRLLAGRAAHVRRPPARGRRQRRLPRRVAARARRSRETVRDAHSLYIETRRRAGPRRPRAAARRCSAAVAVGGARRAGRGARGPVAALAACALHAGRRLGLGDAGADARRARAGRPRAGYQPGSERGRGWPSPMSAWLPLRRGTASPDGRPPARSSRTKKALTPASSVCTSR